MLNHLGQVYSTPYRATGKFTPEQVFGQMARGRFRDQRHHLELLVAQLLGEASISSKYFTVPLHDLDGKVL